MIISQVETPVQLEAVRGLLHEYLDWVLPIEACSHHHPTFIGIDTELASLPGKYAPPGGRLLLATVDGAPAGCVALRPHDGSAGELKRLFVRPGFREHGVGRSLVERAIQEARNCGYGRLVLDSHFSMSGAHRLYESLGFRRVAAPPDFPEQFKPVVVFMERDLFDPPHSEA